MSTALLSAIIVILLITTIIFAVLYGKSRYSEPSEAVCSNLYPVSPDKCKSLCAVLTQQKS